MIITPPDLEIFGVYDRGVPNLERIALRVNQPTNLSTYFLILGIRAPLGVDMVYPIQDQSLWLGSIFIEVPSWIFIYTGNGTTSVSKEIHTGDPVHTLYWKKPNIIFDHNDIVPALFHFDYVEIGNKPNKSIDTRLEQKDNGVLSELSKMFAKSLENKPT